MSGNRRHIAAAVAAVAGLTAVAAVTADGVGATDAEPGACDGADVLIRQWRADDVPGVLAEGRACTVLSRMIVHGLVRDTFCQGDGSWVAGVQVEFVTNPLSWGHIGQFGRLEQTGTQETQRCAEVPFTYNGPVTKYKSVRLRACGTQGLYQACGGWQTVAVKLGDDGAQFPVPPPLPHP